MMDLALKSLSYVYLGSNSGVTEPASQEYFSSASWPPNSLNFAVPTAVQGIDI